MARAIVQKKKIHLVVTQDPHATGLVGSYLKKHFGIPLIVNIHGDFWSREWQRERLSHLIKRYIQHEVIRVADGIRAVSDGIRLSMEKKGIPRDRIRVIHTPINTNLFGQLTKEQQVFEQKLRYKYGDRFVIAFCGRLVAAKNLPFMIDVVRELMKRRKDFFMLIIGDGPMKQQVAEKISSAGAESRVAMLPGKPQNELVVYYHLADLLLLLSTNESFGKVIIEAGLAGTPCLASATTGAQHIIQDGSTGFIVPINDLTATADVLEEMIDYREQTKDLGSRARDLYSEKYTQARTYDLVVKFWMDVARQ